MRSFFSVLVLCSLAAVGCDDGGPPGGPVQTMDVANPGASCAGYARYAQACNDQDATDKNVCICRPINGRMEWGCGTTLGFNCALNTFCDGADGSARCVP